jgi:hypothetical protein
MIEATNLSDNIKQLNTLKNEAIELNKIMSKAKSSTYAY